MKQKIFILILSIYLIAGCIPQKKESIEHLVGLEISSDNVQKFLDKLETKPEISQSESWYTYDYKSKGIRLRFDKKSRNLLGMFLFSELTQNYRQYRGEMPYNLSFDDTRFEVEKKLGEPGSTEEGKTYINTTSQWFDKGLNVTYMTKDANDMMTKISFIVLHEIQ